MSAQLQLLEGHLKNHPMNPSLKAFKDLADKTVRPNVLEIGTRKWGPNSTHHKFLFNNWNEYVMTDYMDGEDVDIVSDAHKLTESFPENYFDFVISCSTFEHLHSPWIAAKEIMKVLKPGGAVWVCTHHTFPVHGYPMDFWRFTREAMEHIFSDAKDIVTTYEYPCKIIPNTPVDVWDPTAPAFLNVNLFGVKP